MVPTPFVRDMIYTLACVIAIVWLLKDYRDVDKRFAAIMRTFAAFIVGFFVATTISSTVGAGLNSLHASFDTSLSFNDPGMMQIVIWRPLVLGCIFGLASLLRDRYQSS